MNAYAKFIIGAAAVLIVVAVGIASFSLGSSTVGGSAQTPAATATPAPTPATSAAPSPSVLGEPPEVTFGGALPADWTVRAGANYAGTTNIQMAFSTDPEDAWMIIELQPNRAAMAADCTLGPEPGVATDATSIIDALATRVGLLAEAPSPAAVGGLTGRQVDLQVDPAVGPTCSGESVGYTPLLGYFAGSDWLFHGLSPDGEVARIIALDATDDRNVIVVISAADAATFDANIDDAMAIVDGLQFDVGP